ncbi:MAG TPA: hypothetical protein VFG99_08255 [Chloroflexia bacterium]|nr:hypothetical protein [Chloroflexia bacterium]
MWNRVFAVLVTVVVTTLIAGPIVSGQDLITPDSQRGLRNDHYYYLARNMVQGNLTVDGIPDFYPDWVEWNGHRYLPLGPLPAVLLIPFLPVLELGLDPVAIGLLFTLLNAWLLYKVLVSIGIRDARLKWSLLLFFGGTVYLSTAMKSGAWFLAHIVTITFLLMAVWAVVGRKLPLAAGVLLGLAGMSRTTALFALPFFVVMLLYKGGLEGEKVSKREMAKRVGMLLLGVSGPVLLLGLYNYARFGSPLDTGYSHVVLQTSVLSEALRHGLFSLEHIPKNLFMLLVQGPLPYPNENAAVLSFPYLRPSPWGMGIFFTSPALLYIFRANRRKPFVLACWLAVACVMIPIITYYGVGWIQFGYRYALDFTPFLVLIAALGFPAVMSNKVRVLVMLSVLVNVWGSIFLMKSY